MRRRHYPSNARARVEVEYSGDPVAVEQQRAIDNNLAAGMDGRSASRLAIYAGMRGGPAGTFHGDLPPAQDFRGGAMLATAMTHTTGMRVALPNTSGPPIEATPIQQLLAQAYGL